MIIRQAEFVISAVGPKQYPDDGLPEIALAGRSNVGKSSLINRMVGRKNLARTSSVPGKTQTLNYYRINGQMYFVDLPGYGYAQVSKAQRAEWGKFIERYLQERRECKLVLLVVDLRHPPSRDDQAMHDWLKHYSVPHAVVATKADKLSRGRWPKHVKSVRETLGMPAAEPVILFSAETGLGKDELWKTVAAAAGLQEAAAGEAGRADA